MNAYFNVAWEALLAHAPWLFDPQVTLTAMKIAGGYALWPAWLMAAAGATLGAMITYGLGIFLSCLKQKAPQERMENISRWYYRIGWVSLVLTGPGLGVLMPLLAGFFKYPWRRVAGIILLTQLAVYGYKVFGG